MSSDPALMQDESQTTQDSFESESLQQRQEAPVNGQEFSNRLPSWEPEKEVFKPKRENETDLPLNAEEATVLVISFLKRMRKHVITPRKAVQKKKIFVVDVDLKDESASVHIDIDTREILEYSIKPRSKEIRSLPLPVRSITIVFGVIVAVVIVFMIFNYLNYHIDIFSIHSDYLLIGAFISLTISGVVWWLRRRG